MPPVRVPIAVPGTFRPTPRHRPRPFVAFDTYEFDVPGVSGEVVAPDTVLDDGRLYVPPSPGWRHHPLNVQESINSRWLASSDRIPAPLKDVLVPKCDAASQLEVRRIAGVDRADTTPAPLKGFLPDEAHLARVASAMAEWTAVGPDDDLLFRCPDPSLCVSRLEAGAMPKVAVSVATWVSGVRDDEPDEDGRFPDRGDLDRGTDRVVARLPLECVPELTSRGVRVELPTGWTEDDCVRVGEAVVLDRAAPMTIGQRKILFDLLGAELSRWPDAALTDLPARRAMSLGPDDLAGCEALTALGRDVATSNAAIARAVEILDVGCYAYARRADMAATFDGFGP